MGCTLKRCSGTMEHDPKKPTPPVPSDYPISYLSNGGVQRYLLEAESTTGFVAFKIADGTILINAAPEVSLPASPSISFWPCAGYRHTRHPSGLAPAAHRPEIRFQRQSLTR